MDTQDYEIVTICGSMRYFDAMLETAQRLTDMGKIVLMPFVKKGEGSTDIAMLDDMHKAKINMSEAIYIVGDHIGESTRSEIEYAESCGIDICYL